MNTNNQKTSSLILSWMVFSFFIVVSTNGQGNYTSENLSGNDVGQVYSNNSGTLVSNLEQTIDAGASDFQAWNWNGEHEINTRNNPTIGKYGKDGDSHFLLYNMDFPIISKITGIAIYGLDQSQDKGIRVTLKRNNLLNGQLETMAVLNPTIGLYTSNVQELGSVIFSTPIDADNKVYAYFLEVTPVVDLDPVNDTSWVGNSLSVRNVSIFYERF